MSALAFATRSRPRTPQAETAPPNAPAEVRTTRQARISAVGQPPYIAHTLDVQRIQNALRAAERGDTWLLFAIFRDMYASYDHLQSEWAKRKMVITGNPETLIPYDANDEDDVVACDVTRQMIDGCRNWFDGLNHLLDATLYPLAAAEKIYAAASMAEDGKYKYPLRFTLKEIAPIDPSLLCFKLPYMPGYTSKENGEGRFNPDDWEAWLRFYAVSDHGMPMYSMQGIYRPNPNIHIIHRGNMISPQIPPNFGGHMRTILFPWLLATQGRDWWALLMQKYGMPIPVAKVNTQQEDTVARMQQAMSLCAQLGGLVIDTHAEIDWAAVASTDSSGAHRMFQDWLDSRVSRIVIGQTLSAKPEKTGMGSGASQQSEEIREDYRKGDTSKLSDTLKNQLYAHFLDVNGYSGRPPRTIWGGMRAGEAANYAKTQTAMKAAGLRPTDRGIRTINENMGVEYELDPMAALPSKSESLQDINQPGSNPGRVKY